MRDHNEFCAEISRRKKKIIERKKQRKKALFTFVPMAMCLAVIATFPWKLLTPPEIGEDELSSEKYGYDSGDGENITVSGKPEADSEWQSVIEDDKFEETLDYDNMPEAAETEEAGIADGMESDAEESSKYSLIYIESNRGIKKYSVTSVKAFVDLLYCAEGVNMISGTYPETDLDDGTYAEEDANGCLTESISPSAPDATENIASTEAVETEALDTEAAEPVVPETEVDIEGDFTAPEDLPSGGVSTNTINIYRADGEEWVFTVDDDNFEKIIERLDALYNSMS